MTGDRFTYCVEMHLPHRAAEIRGSLAEALHRSDRRIGVVTGGNEDGMHLSVLTPGRDERAARDHALRLTSAALETLDRANLLAGLEVRGVTPLRVRPGGVRRVAAPSSLAYREVSIPDGRVLSAACEGPLGEWVVFLTDAPERVLTGRGLPSVLHELFEFDWGKPRPWIRGVIEELAGQPTRHGIRYACPCCDQLTLRDPPPGTYAICRACRWEDDNAQFREPDLPGGASRISLRTARENFARYGHSEPNRPNPPRPGPEFLRIKAEVHRRLGRDPTNDEIEDFLFARARRRSSPER